MSGVRPGTITVVITDTDWSLWPDHPRVIDSRDNDNQQQPILSQQLAESGAGQTWLKGRVWPTLFFT